MNYIKPFRISRRHMLRGMGATMCLPFMEAMGATKSSLTVGPEGQPIRFGAIFMPNGVDASRYNFSENHLNNLPPILAPLSGLTEHINVISGLNNSMGGHAGSTAGFLTGQPPGRAENSNEVNIGNASVDQLIGYADPESTPLPTLELAMHAPRRGTSPSGLPWTYGNCVSWRNATTPVPQEVNPMRAFKRLFEHAAPTSKGSRSKENTFAPNKSVVDTVLADAKQLQKRLGKGDQQKLDEYLTTVRDVEVRILRKAQPKGLKITEEIFTQIKGTEKRVKGLGGSGKLSALPKIEYPEYVKIMMDIMALAFWSNSTRSSTLMLGDGASRRNMSFLDGVSGGFHSISHHGNNPEKLKQYSIINTFFMSQYAYFLERLHSMKEGSSSVLENSIIMMGSGISNGQGHAKVNVPIVLGGHAGGKLKTNRRIEVRKRTPIASLHRSILDIMNIKNGINGEGGTIPNL